MAYTAIVETKLMADARPLGDFANLDWETSIRGVGAISVATGSPWTTTSYGPYSWESYYAFESDADPVGRTFPIEVEATPRADCAGWSLDRWCLLLETAPAVFTPYEVRPQGQKLGATVTVLAHSQGHLYIYPYFVFHGTGNLLATPNGGSLLGRVQGANEPSLLIDL